MGKKGQIPWNKGKKGLKKFPKELYPNYGMRGKHLTREAKKKISIGGLGKHKYWLGKKYERFLKIYKTHLNQIA
jgi:hypothetical protein